MRARSVTPGGSTAGGSRRVFVLLLPGVHALDLGGAVQAVYEANGFGASYRIRFVGRQREVQTAQAFAIGSIEPLPEVDRSDWVIVPGTESSRLDRLDVPTAWLRAAAERGARVSSVCSGAFALAAAGLLDGRCCTTHWKLTERLQAARPASRVLQNRLFVRDGNIVTSAGEASGIDMTLALIEEDHGSELVAKVAREMVVYVRRSGDSEQRSIYLEHRDHTHPGVHRVQDWIVANPDRRATVDAMAELAALSPRHLTRVFKAATGTTLSAFAQKVKLEVAGNLIANRGVAIDEIAGHCGFADARQLRRLWKRAFGMTLRAARRGGAGAGSVSRAPSASI